MHMLLGDNVVKEMTHRIICPSTKEMFQIFNVKYMIFKQHYSFYKILLGNISAQNPSYFLRKHEH